MTRQKNALLVRFLKKFPFWSQQRADQTPSIEAWACCCLRIVIDACISSRYESTRKLMIGTGCCWPHLTCGHNSRWPTGSLISGLVSIQLTTNRRLTVLTKFLTENSWMITDAHYTIHLVDTGTSTLTAVKPKQQKLRFWKFYSI